MKKKWKLFGLVLALVCQLLSCSPTARTAQSLPPAAESSITAAENSSQTAAESIAETAAEAAAEAASQTAGETPAEAASLESLSSADFPVYSGAASVVYHDNRPLFSESDFTFGSGTSFSPLDSLGRCGTAMGILSPSTLPTEKRGSIGMVKPAGWHTVKYAGIDGNYLYNRCHLIAYELCGVNAEPRNLTTGTRYLNVQGMLPLENETTDYIRRTGNTVLYRVTPIFDGDNLVCSGVLMEAASAGDQGADYSFCAYCYDVQPGITINYADGSSSGPEFTGSDSGNSGSGSSDSGSTGSNAAGGNSADVGNSAGSENSGAAAGAVSGAGAAAAGAAVSGNTADGAQDYVLNTNTMKFHYPSCSSVQDMKAKNRKDVHETRDQIIADGYQPCKRCNP
jgi:DNA-entry nuclease